jgi:hypothetical protein
VRFGLHRSVLVSMSGLVISFFAGCPVADLSFVEELVLICFAIKTIIDPARRARWEFVVPAGSQPRLHFPVPVIGPAPWVRLSL